MTPQRRQQRARKTLEEVAREEGVAQHGDALDELARAHPGELGGLDGSLDSRGLGIEPSPLRRNRSGLGRCILRRGRPELPDQVLDRRKPGPELLGCFDRALEDSFNVYAKLPQLAFDLLQVLEGLFGRFDALGEFLHGLGEFGRKSARRGSRDGLLRCLLGQGGVVGNGKRTECRTYQEPQDHDQSLWQSKPRLQSSPLSNARPARSELFYGPVARDRKGT